MASQGIILTSAPTESQLGRGAMLQGTATSLQIACSQNTAGLRCNHTQTSAINNAHTDVLSDEREFLHCVQTKFPSLKKR